MTNISDNPKLDYLFPVIFDDVILLDITYEDNWLSPHTSFLSCVSYEVLEFSENIIYHLRQCLFARLKTYLRARSNLINSLDLLS